MLGWAGIFRLNPINWNFICWLPFGSGLYEPNSGSGLLLSWVWTTCGRENKTNTQILLGETWIGRSEVWISGVSIISFKFFSFIMLRYILRFSHEVTLDNNQYSCCSRSKIWYLCYILRTSERSGRVSKTGPKMIFFRSKRVQVPTIEADL